MRRLLSPTVLVGLALSVAGCGGSSEGPKATIASAYTAEMEDVGFTLVLDNVGTPEDGLDGTFVGYAGEEMLFADVTDLKYNGTNLTFRATNIEDPSDWAEFRGTGDATGIEGDWILPAETRSLDQLPRAFASVTGSGSTGKFGGKFLNSPGPGQIEYIGATLTITEFLPPVKKGKPQRATGHLYVWRNTPAGVFTDEDWTGDYTAGTTIQSNVTRSGMYEPLTIVFNPKTPNTISVRYGPSHSYLQRR
jgi:hypothetical protein